jgi:hypothetical protein
VSVIPDSDGAVEAVTVLLEAVRVLVKGIRVGEFVNFA